MDNQKLDIAAVTADIEDYASEFTLAELGKSSKGAPPSKAVTISSFKAAYPKTIRPILVAAASLLNIFKPSWSAYIAQTIAFLDVAITP